MSILKPRKRKKEREEKEREKNIFTKSSLTIKRIRRVWLTNSLATNIISFIKFAESESYALYFGPKRINAWYTSIDENLKDKTKKIALKKLISNLLDTENYTARENFDVFVNGSKITNADPRDVLAFTLHIEKRMRKRKTQLQRELLKEKKQRILSRVSVTERDIDHPGTSQPSQTAQGQSEAPTESKKGRDESFTDQLLASLES